MKISDTQLPQLVDQFLSDVKNIINSDCHVSVMIRLPDAVDDADGVYIATTEPDLYIVAEVYEHAHNRMQERESNNTKEEIDEWEEQALLEKKSNKKLH